MIELDAILGFIGGLIVGIGSAVYYLRRKAKKQMEDMAEELGDMFE